MNQGGWGWSSSQAVPTTRTHPGTRTCESVLFLIVVTNPIPFQTGGACCFRLVITSWLAREGPVVGNVINKERLSTPVFTREGIIVLILRHFIIYSGCQSRWGEGAGVENVVYYGTLVYSGYKYKGFRIRWREDAGVENRIGTILPSLFTRRCLQYFCLSIHAHIDLFLVQSHCPSMDS